MRSSRSCSSGGTISADPPKKPPYLFKTPTTEPPTCYITRRLSIPDDLDWLMWVNGAVSLLLSENSWMQSDGGQSVATTIEVFTEMWLDYLGELETMIGAVIPMITDVLPPYMLWADGSTYDRADYPDLYGRLPSAFIVDADTFFVPDLRGRTVVGSGEGTGLTDRPLGVSGGEEEHQLTVDEMPEHTHSNDAHAHTYNYPAFNLDLEAPGVPDLLGAGNPGIPTLTSYESISINNTGGDEAHNNMQPFLALRFAIVAKSRDAC